MSHDRILAGLSKRVLACEGVFMKVIPRKTLWQSQKTNSNPSVIQWRKPADLHAASQLPIIPVRPLRSRLLGDWIFTLDRDDVFAVSLLPKRIATINGVESNWGIHTGRLTLVNKPMGYQFYGRLESDCSWVVGIVDLGSGFMPFEGFKV